MLSGKNLQGTVFFTARKERVSGFSLLKENDDVDFLLLFSLLKILMVPVITIHAMKSGFSSAASPASWLQFTVSKPRG